jgi:hypothetical protein
MGKENAWGQSMLKGIWLYLGEEIGWVFRLRQFFLGK